MKFHLLSLLIAFNCLIPNIYANEKTDTSRIEPWLGTWAGTLKIYNNQGMTQTVPMKIKHFSTDTLGTYGWFLIYGDEDTGTRSYYLKTVDEGAGIYRVDEKNSIYLDEYMIGNRMISNFDVEGSLITSIYTLKEDGNMVFEIIFGSSDNPKISGDTQIKDQKIPKVYSYDVKGYQRAFLTRTDE